MSVSAMFTGGWMSDPTEATVEIIVSGNVDAVVASGNHVTATIAPGDSVTGVAGGPPSEIRATLSCEDPTP
jgi:hypothetical protein